MTLLTMPHPFHALLFTAVCDGSRAVISMHQYERLVYYDHSPVSSTLLVTCSCVVYLFDWRVNFC
eukprot:m.506204 g.506204  ORF g.506204 m.506204 type:complete len:65 (+) comp21873_c0_seq2:2191-2385(+)